MKNIFLFSSAITLLCAGCATSYQERGFWGDGYSEIRTNPDAFIVTFKGNRYTDPDEVMRYILLRASELTLQNGYKYFVVLSSQDRTASYDYVYTDANASDAQKIKHHYRGVSKGSIANASVRTTSGTIASPGKSIQIKCFQEKPMLDDSIDAVFYWNANSLQ
jgi:hypothetical protein